MWVDNGMRPENIRQIADQGDGGRLLLLYDLSYFAVWPPFAGPKPNHCDGWDDTTAMNYSQLVGGTNAIYLSARIGGKSRHCH